MPYEPIYDEEGRRDPRRRYRDTETGKEVGRTVGEGLTAKRKLQPPQVSAYDRPRLPEGPPPTKGERRPRRQLGQNPRVEKDRYYRIRYPSLEAFKKENRIGPLDRVHLLVTGRHTGQVMRNGKIIDTDVPAGMYKSDISGRFEYGRLQDEEIEQRMTENLRGYETIEEIELYVSYPEIEESEGGEA